MKTIDLIGKIFAGCTLLAFTGCVREFKDPAKVTLRVPQTWQSKTEAQNVEGTLMYIAVNIRGEGITGVIPWVWTREEKSGSETEKPPSQITIDVPTGPRRLIQYVGVYELNDKRVQFTYADTLRDLPNGDVAVTIQAKEIYSPTDDHILAGRYLTDATSGPTDLLTGSLKILKDYSSLGSAPPDVDLLKYGMFNGWFKTLIFKGVPLTWKTSQGTPIFDGVELDSAEFNANENVKVMRVSIPRHKIAWPDSAGKVDMNSVYEDGAQEIIYGLFGGGVEKSNFKKVCYTSGRENDLTIPGLYSTDLVDSDKDGIVDNEPGARLRWDDQSCSATSPSGGAACRKGGLAFSQDTVGCKPEDSDHIKMQHENLGRGFDGALGFNGPFKVQGEAMFGEYVSSIFDGQKFSLFWSYISPEVKKSLGGVSIYYKNAAEHFSGGGAGDQTCEKIAVKAGYTHLVDAAVSSDESVAGSYVWEKSSGSYDTKFILCPFARDPKTGLNLYFPELVASHQVRGPANRLSVAVDKAGGTAYFTGLCYPVRVELKDTAGQPTVALQDLPYTLTAAPLVGSPSPALFYTQPGCGGAGAESATGTIAAGQSGMTLYVVPSDPGSVSVQATAESGTTKLSGSAEGIVQQSLLSLTYLRTLSDGTIELQVSLYVSEGGVTMAITDRNFISPITVTLGLKSCQNCGLALTSPGSSSQSLTLSLSATQITHPFFLQIPAGTQSGPVTIEATSKGVTAGTWSDQVQ